MNDIARAAQVHTSTVSLALRGSPRISTATRERVVAVARSLGYRPNPLVTALMQSRRSHSRPQPVLTAAYLSFEALSPVLRREPIYPEFERGARDEAARHGLSLEKFKVTADMPPARIDQILRARGTMGVVVAPLPPEQSALELDWQNLAAVAIGPTLHTPLLHQVMSNHYANMGLLLDACLAWGYRRPGLILHTPSDQRIGGQWEACFLRQQAENSALEHVPLHKYSQLDPKAMLRWIHRHTPDILLCISPQEILHALEESGLRVPQDISLASVSAARPGGSLSGVVEDGVGAGAQAVSQLLRLIYANERGTPEKPVKILLPASVHRGQTTR